MARESSFKSSTQHHDRHRRRTGVPNADTLLTPSFPFSLGTRDQHDAQRGFLLQMQPFSARDSMECSSTLGGVGATLTPGRLRTAPLPSGTCICQNTVSAVLTSVPPVQLQTFGWVQSLRSLRLRCSGTPVVRECPRAVEHNRANDSALAKVQCVVLFGEQVKLGLEPPCHACQRPSTPSRTPILSATLYHAFDFITELQ